MKTVYFLFITVIALANLSFAYKGNSPDCRLRHNGELLPDPDDCSHFYKCHRGRALRKNCARGFSFDENVKVCNLAALVNCKGYGDRSTPSPHIKPITDPSDETTTVCPTTTTTCSTTTTPCSTTTTPCSTTTTPCSTTTTPCSTTTTSCSTTTTTCSTTTTTCSTTTTTCSTTTTTCSTTTTTCSTTTTPCSTTTTPCSTTTTPCSTTTTCTTTKTCTTTTTSCPTTTESPTTEKKPIVAPEPGTANPLISRNDCSSLADGTRLYDTRHCRRFYVCLQGRPKRLKCRSGDWFDIEKQNCRNRREVTNCRANCN